MLFKQLALILALSCILGLSVNVGLIKKYFKGDFEQAFLPYPILIIFYLLLVRSKAKTSSSTEHKDHSIRY